jgi:hypothetical protein
METVAKWPRGGPVAVVRSYRSSRLTSCTRCQAGDRSIPEVARGFDLVGSAVRRWVEQDEIDAASAMG